MWYAHRWAWFVAGMDLPIGMYVLHTCDNRLCVNIEHLKIGTALENARERGERSGFRASLYRRSVERAKLIREARSQGMDTTDISNKFNISLVSVFLILRGETYSGKATYPNKVACLDGNLA